MTTVMVDKNSACFVHSLKIFNTENNISILKQIVSEIQKKALKFQ